MASDNSLANSFDSLSQESHSKACNCDSCRLKAGNNLYVSIGQTGSKYLETAGLISTAFSNHTANALRASGGETLEYYIHNESGITEFDDNTYGYSLGHSPGERNFIGSIFDRIDKYIDLDFIESSDWVGSTFDIYCLDSYSEWGATTVGQVNDY